MSRQTPNGFAVWETNHRLRNDSGVTATCGDTAASVKEDDVTLSSFPMCRFETLTAIAAGHRTLEPSSEEVLVPHLTAGGTTLGGQTVAQYVKYGEDHPDVISKPSLSCGGIKLSYRFGHWLGNVRLTPSTKESASAKRGCIGASISNFDHETEVHRYSPIR